MIHYRVCVYEGVCEVYDDGIFIGGVYAPRCSEEELLKMAEVISEEHKETTKQIIQGGIK